MTNSIIITIDLTLVVIAMVTFFFALVRFRHQNAAGWFYALCAGTLSWLLCDLLIHASSRMGRVVFYTYLRLVLVGVTSALLFVFLLRYFRVGRPGSSFYLLCFLPSVGTALLALSGDAHALLFEQLVVSRLTPLVRVIQVPGPWHRVHMAYCYLLLLGALVLLLCQNRKLPRSYRRPSYLMLGGICCAIGCNVLAIASWEGYDATLVGMVLILILFCLGIVSGDKMDFLILARREIFHYIEDKIFILSRTRQVMDVNQAARIWMNQLGIEEETPDFARVTAHLTAADFVPNQAEDFPEGLGVYTAQTPHLAVYQMREQTVVSRRGDPMGTFVTLTDVTRYRSLVDRMEQAMGIDPLTGLGNRNRYERVYQELDAEGHLPLAVLIGDINGLKEVNDNQGHLAGDRLLQVCAQAMESACKERGHVFRIGGDEFACLMPKTDRGDAALVVEQIARNLSGVEEMDPEPSIALGFDIKERANQKYSDIFRNADLAMYQNKHYDRRKGPPDRRMGPLDRREGL